MARSPKTQPGTEVVDWEKQMAEQADLQAATQRSTGGGGKFFSMRAGQLNFDGNPMPGNQMAVVILGAIMENSYFDTPFDPDTPAAPKCFAFAETEDELEPHEEVDKNEYFERQNDQCAGCPQNEWGSARTGRGKACSNVMRLVMIPAGAYKSKGGRNAGLELELFDDPEHFEKADAAYMKLPVMSVRNYAAYVKALAADMRRPPWGMLTNIAVEPDPKSQFRVVFEAIDVAPKEILGPLMKRHHTEQASIGFPYNPPMTDDAQTPPPKTNNKLAKKPAARR